MSDTPRRIVMLEKRLGALPTEEPMLVSELDGYVAGIIVCPDVIMPSEWLPHVWGIGHEPSDTVFASAGEAQRLIALVMEHYNAVAAALGPNPGAYRPVFEIDTRHDEVLWELWISGLERAMDLRPDAWGLFHASDQTREAITGLTTLIRISNVASDLPQDQVDRLTIEAPDLIPGWIEELSALRLNRDTSTMTMNEPMTFSSKVARNEPCPCGSGKKYKKCCGLN